MPLVQIGYAVPTFVLVIVTGYYAWKTGKILEESKKTRDATERLAKTSEQSIKLAQEQILQASLITRTIVASAINAARTNIEQWKTIDIHTYALHSRIPENVNLVPLNAQSAIENSRLISSDGTSDLMGAFEDLRRASWELNILSKLQRPSQDMVEPHSKAVKIYLERAFSSLEAATTHFSEASSSTTKSSLK